MCGLFGFVSLDGSPPARNLVWKLAMDAANRGPDSWGLITRTLEGRNYEIRQRKALRHEEIPATNNVAAFIGHCRLATIGGLGIVQPIEVHGDGRTGWIAHNGNYYRSDRMKKERGFSTVTDCDSEVLGLAVMQDATGPDLSPAIRSHLMEAPVTRHAVLMMDSTRYAAVGSGQPLWYSKSMAAVYFSSFPFPGAVRLSGGMDFAMIRHGG